MSDLRDRKFEDRVVGHLEVGEHAADAAHPDVDRFVIEAPCLAGLVQQGSGPGSNRRFAQRSVTQP